MSSAFPRLSHEQLRRLRAYGTPQVVAPGEVLYGPGDRHYDLVVVEDATVEIAQPATRHDREEPIVTFGPGTFLGELNKLTGQDVYLVARVVAPGRVHRIPAAGFRRLMSEDAQLSGIVLEAFRARRALLTRNAAARGLQLVGRAMDASALALRTYAARRRLPHRSLDADSPAGIALMDAASLTSADLPAAVLPERVLRRADPGRLAAPLGLSYRAAEPGTTVDVTVVGAGPAGLAAAVYAASEGLTTVVLDAVAPGGQAAATTRIENYLFPSGISGGDLAERAETQALRFGARISAPCRVVALETEGALRAILADGTRIPTRALMIATGARYRSLPLARWDEFVGAGIFFAATEIEARACAGRPVTVVGGGNGAGQAALHLAFCGCEVTVALRRPELEASMSRYLVDRLRGEPRITVRGGTQVTRLHGTEVLEQITLTDCMGAAHEQRCDGLFCFIGAEPATGWLTGITLDGDGFIRTDVELASDDLGDAWAALDRRPLPFETNVPGVFAVGDVRCGSTKRVAAAAGEGASAVRSVHAAIGVRA